MGNKPSSIGGAEPQQDVAVDEESGQLPQDRRSNDGRDGDRANNADLANDEEGGLQTANPPAKYPVLDWWRPVLQRLVDRPTMLEFLELTPEEESAIKSRGRDSTKSKAVRTSKLPTRHDHSHRMLEGDMTSLTTDLRQLSHGQDFLVREHQRFQTGAHSLSSDLIEAFTKRWMHLDRKAQPLLAAAALNRELCIELLARPYVATLLSRQHILAPFPGCAPNQVQLAKRRRLHQDYVRYVRLQQIKAEMELSAEVVKMIARGLYSVQSAMYATILFARPNFFSLEDPEATELVSMNGVWDVQKEARFILSVTELLDIGEGGETKVIDYRSTRDFSGILQVATQGPVVDSTATMYDDTVMDLT